MKKKITRKQLDALLDKFGNDVPGLREKLEAYIREHFDVEENTGLQLEMLSDKVAPELPAFVAETDTGFSFERIIISEAGARPVARIVDDKVTASFLGENAGENPWGDVLMEAADKINKAIPAIGRIELKNGDLPWCGTGWLIKEGILVTNAHVAEIFARLDGQSAAFVFRPGLRTGPVQPSIDFKQEEGSDTKNVHPITEVLYIAPPGEPDVAFLRVVPAHPGAALPSPVPLARTVAGEGSTIVAIGYPAKDRTIRDQRLVTRIFGADVFDKKRLAPGKLTQVNGDRLQHDCSTLGGNSGSVLLDLNTGEAIGLHQGGYMNDSANLGVTIDYLKQLLEEIEQKKKDSQTAMPAARPEGPPGAPSEGITITLKAPAQVTITDTNGELTLNIAHAGSPGVTAAPAIDVALKQAREAFAGDPSVTIRKGFRFKNGWITDEAALVFEVREKLDLWELAKRGLSPFPREINGMGVDVRVVDGSDDADYLDLPLLALERKAAAAGYTEPPGFDDENSEFFLRRVRERMDAVFHVSPDAGFAHLKDFIAGTREKLTATIYEWEVNHISDALQAAMQRAGTSLKMVTQRTGVAESDATITAVEDMKERIGDQFEHVYASTRGPNRLIPNSYHIKVASRDGEGLWLSSGNWKNSNQPLDPTRFSSLKDFNREWHVILNNPTLAQLFQRYIDFDFDQATKFPTAIREAVAPGDEEFFIPDNTPEIRTERIAGVDYEDTLVIKNELLDIQPLLTPDRDPDGGPLFINHLIDLVRRATKSLYIQNQSFNLTPDNNAEFDELFDEIRKKQRAIGDVRIIFRDATDYGRAKDIDDQILLLERLKEKGFDTSSRSIRIQSRCHNKGVVVDSKEVLIGSQNLTNGGALFNRDASLLIRNKKVAAFYEKIFLFDWEHLAHNKIIGNARSIRRARPGEAVPEGFRKVTLKELLAERD